MPILFFVALPAILLGLLSLLVSQSHTLVASKTQRTLTISSVTSVAGITMPSSSGIQVIPFSDIQSIGFRKWCRTAERADGFGGWVEGTEASRYIAVNTKDKCITLAEESSPARFGEGGLKKIAKALHEYIDVGGIDDE